MVDLVKLEELAKAATQERWVDTLFLTQDGKREHTAEDAGESARLSFSKSESPYLHGVIIAGDDVVIAYTGNGPTSEANSAFIAAANPAVILELLAEIKRLRNARESQIDYSIDLQRIIEDLCNNREIRAPRTSAKHHYEMALKHQAAARIRKHPEVME